MKWNKYSNFNVANENILDVKKYLKEHYVAFPFLRIALNKKKSLDIHGKYTSHWLSIKQAKIFIFCFFTDLVIMAVC